MPRLPYNELNTAMNKIRVKVPIFLLVTVVFLVSVPGLTHASRIGLPTDFLKMNQTLTGWWTFDGNHTTWPSSGATTTLDISGNARTGTLNGFTQNTAIAPGKIGQAISFSGSNYISLTNALSNFMSAATGTISVWLRPSAGNGGACADNTASGIFVDGTGTGGYMFFSHDGTNMCGGAWDGDYRVVSAAAAVGVWTHAVLVHSLGNLYLYKNGVLADSTPLGNITDLTHAVWMGRSFGDIYFRGSLDDIRAWSTALSATDVAQLYAAARGNFMDVSLVGGGTLNQGLVGWWTFDGKDTVWTSATAATTLDKSGSNDTGTLTNMSQSMTPAGGKIGQGLSFNGSNGYVDMSTSYNGVKSVSFWFKPNNTTQSIVDLNGSTATISTSGGTVTAGAGFTTPTVYVDGVVSSAANDTGWHHIVVTTDTGINATALKIGVISSSYYAGTMDDVRLYSRVLSLSDVKQLYNLGK